MYVRSPGPGPLGIVRGLGKSELGMETHENHDVILSRNADPM